MTFNDSFLKACRGEPAPHIPVWYMRQAGRYQPEYREIRKKNSLFDICRKPEVCAEVTTLPVTQLGVDAAILFSDITIPFSGIGVDFTIKENIGPVTAKPIREDADISALTSFNPAQSIPYVGESVKRLKEKLNVPLIGFAGAPFTLASYLVEGGPSKRFIHVKTMMYTHPERWGRLMDHLTETVLRHAAYQVDHGADAIQIFDSWVGQLDENDYRKYVLPWMKKIFTGLNKYKIPLIHFGVGTGHMLGAMKEAGAGVSGIDWKTPFSVAENALGQGFPVQGNLDPTVLLAPWEVLKEKALQILEQAPEKGFIFNLGHGILPPTPVENLQKLTRFVHEYSRQSV